MPVVHGVPTPDPTCPVPRTAYEPTTFAVPAGACDTHAHVVSPDTARYPLVPNRSYTPGAATAEAYLAMLRGTGMSRGVLVQISVYGTDNGYLLQTLRRHPDELRGVVVVDPDIDGQTLGEMDDAGVRGVRINALFGGGIGIDLLEAVAERIQGMGWHLQLLIDARALPDLAPRIRSLPVPVVFDHLGHPPAGLGAGHPGFHTLLDLLSGQDCWVKLSGAYRIDRNPPDYPEARSLATEVLRVAPDRVLYGSDWPHVAVPGLKPDAGQLRNLLATWIPDAELRRKVLVANPARLYGFPTP